MKGVELKLQIVSLFPIMMLISVNMMLTYKLPREKLLTIYVKFNKPQDKKM